MHLQRTIVGRLHRHDELSRSTGGSSQAMGAIVTRQNPLKRATLTARQRARRGAFRSLADYGVFEALHRRRCLPAQTLMPIHTIAAKCCSTSSSATGIRVLG